MLIRKGGLPEFLGRNGTVILHSIYRRVIEGNPLAFSFNVSDRCPVGCDCYWRAQGRVEEMSDEAVVAFFRKMRDNGYAHVSMAGGEPYVRKELLSRLAGILPWSWLVTSATTPLLSGLKNTVHIVSIDGARAETHDRVRKMPGLYERILKNVGNARSKGWFPMIVHSTLNAVNYQEVADTLKTWSTNGLADGIMVSTMTPIRGAQHNEYQLSRNQRVWIVQELLRLKEEYGNFLVVSPDQIRRLHPDYTIGMRPESCAMSTMIPSFDAAGNRISQCVLSEKADCSQCGCISSAMSGAGGSRLTNLIESCGAVGKTLSIG